jgi:type IV pilus secretin PilQ/predicted competence protein
LVIDLPSERARLNQNYSLSDLEYLAGIRVGAHPDKSRIVLDLAQVGGVTHEASVVDGRLVVILKGAPGTASAPTGDLLALSSSPASSNENLLEAELLATSTGPLTDIADELVAATSISPGAATSVVDLEQTTVADSTNLELSTPQLGESKTEQVAAASKLASVRLEQGAGNSPMVVIDAQGNPDYAIRKTAPSEYVLTIRDAALDESASAMPLLAEPGAKGIRSVRSATEGRDTQVRIFAQPDTYLTARNTDGRIIVEETRDMAQVANDMRAQAAPPKAEPEQAEPSKPKAGQDKPKDDSAAGTTAKVTVSSDAGASELSEGDVGALLGDESQYTGRLISLDLQDTDIDNALRIIAEVSNLNIVASDDVTGKVTLRLIDVPWDQALDVILKTNGLDKVLEGNVMRIAPVGKLREEREALKQAQEAEEDLEPLSVKYMRVSYAKAAELKALVETVLSSRGTVAYDERSNQLIVKDVRGGVKNVAELVNKVDLRTPQVLLETQIVESSRNLSRELGAELGFSYIQSPQTGNGTGLNFPAAIAIGGSAVPGAAGITGSAFPVAAGPAGGSAITMLFDSADGTKSLEFRLSQLEQDGRVRIISKPAVATTNNKAAQIKSVEKVRVRLPNGGLSVATGSGASAAGAGNIATETIEAGITLDVTPQASPDYFVLLDIKARSSTFGAREVEGIPSEIERSASSTVLVSSGQTFALGGIYKLTDGDRVSGVPFFKDIPFFGHFFRRSVVNDSDEELLFFITPRIVEGSFDDAAMKSAT